MRSKQKKLMMKWNVTNIAAEENFKSVVVCICSKKLCGQFIQEFRCLIMSELLFITG